MSVDRSNHQDPFHPLRVLDERDPVRSRVRKATRILVAVHLKTGSDAAETRRRVTAAVAGAFDAPEIPVREFVVGNRPEPCTTPTGVYRLLLDHIELDRSNLRHREDWLATARRMLDEGLPAFVGTPGARLRFRPLSPGRPS